MSRRFYSARPVDSDSIVLEGSEAHHLSHVMRATAGDEVTVFDGTGTEYQAVVERIQRNQVHLSVRGRQSISRELPCEVVLAVALPKGDRQEWLVQKVVELGITQLIPLQTERSVVVPRDRTVQRLQRVVIEACKQCGRNRLMEISDPVSFDELRSMPASARYLAHVDARPLPSFGECLTEVPPRLLVGIGPEGGFTDDEVQSAVGAGWTTFGLGKRILRTETAAVAVASILAWTLERDQA